MELGKQDLDAKHEKPGCNKSRWLLALIVTLIFAGFLLLDLLLPWAFDGIPGLVLLCVVVAQLTLICVWGTLVEGTFWINLPWTLLMLVVSWLALCYGVHLSGNSESTAELFGLGLIWFYGFLISFIPLKLAAFVFRWHIGREQASESKQSRFAIRDMMIGTGILAVALRLGRMFFPRKLPSWSEVVSALDFLGVELFILLAVFGFVSLIVKLPCIWIALATPRVRFLRTAIGWVVVSGLLGLLEFGLISSVLGPPGREAIKVCFALVVGHMAMAAVMIGVLFFLRFFGYFLYRPNSVAHS